MTDKNAQSANLARPKIARPKVARSNLARSPFGPTRRHFLATGAMFGAASSVAVAPSPARAAPRADLIDRHWLGSGAGSQPDQRVWAAFVAQYRTLPSDGVARLRYGAVSSVDRQALRSYITAMAAARPTAMQKPEQFAYWANLYNAVTIDLVLEAYPVSSIKRVRGGLFGTGPWRDKVVTVEGRQLSLDDIEHGILRPVFKDPRIHYAVNCASIGCPNLPAVPLTGARLEAELNAGARAYVNHARGARVEGGRLTVSSIYDWFESDFGSTDAGVIEHLRRHAEPTLAAALSGVERVHGDDYDWALNDAT